MYFKAQNIILFIFRRVNIWERDHADSWHFQLWKLKNQNKWRYEWFQNNKKKRSIIHHMSNEKIDYNSFVCSVAFYYKYLHLRTLVEYRFDWIAFLIDGTLCRMYRQPKHLTVQVHRYRSYRTQFRHFKNNQFGTNSIFFWLITIHTSNSNEIHL